MLVLHSLVFPYQSIYGRIQRSLACSFWNFIEIDLAVNFSVVGFVFDGECALGAAIDNWLFECQYFHIISISTMIDEIPLNLVIF